MLPRLRALWPEMTDEHWMSLALAEAERARGEAEVPVGAVVVLAGDLLATGRNRRERDQDPLAHAEVLALREAASKVGSWRLIGCTMYVTLEPCAMCAGLIVNARLGRLVYGCDDPKAGACHSLYQITDDSRLNHRCTVVAGVLTERCSALLSDFFANKRRLGKR